MQILLTPPPSISRNHVTMFLSARGSVRRSAIKLHEPQHDVRSDEHVRGPAVHATAGHGHATGQSSIFFLAHDVLVCAVGVDYFSSLFLRGVTIGRSNSRCCYSWTDCTSIRNRCDHAENKKDEHLVVDHLENIFEGSCASSDMSTNSFVSRAHPCFVSFTHVHRNSGGVVTNIYQH